MLHFPVLKRDRLVLCLLHAVQRASHVRQSSRGFLCLSRCPGCGRAIRRFASVAGCIHGTHPGLCSLAPIAQLAPRVDLLVEEAFQQLTVVDIFEAIDSGGDGVLFWLPRSRPRCGSLPCSTTAASLASPHRSKICSGPVHGVGPCGRAVLPRRAPAGRVHPAVGQAS